MLAYYDSIYGPVPVKVIGADRQGPKWVISVVVTSNFPKRRKDQARCTRSLYKRYQKLSINGIWIFPRDNVILTENGNIAATVKHDPATVFAGFVKHKEQNMTDISTTTTKEPKKPKQPKAYVPKTDLQVINGSRALINKPEKWAKGANAMNAEGSSVNGAWDYYEGEDNTPVKFCAYGAIERYLWLNRDKNKPHYHSIRGRGNQIVERYFRPADDSQSKTFPWRITEFNDTKTHKEVMKLFSEAAKRAKMSEANATARSQEAAAPKTDA